MDHTPVSQVSANDANSGAPSDAAATRTRTAPGVSASVSATSPSTIARGAVAMRRLSV